MTAEEYKDITRAVVLALREKLALDNKDVIAKLSEVDNKLNYDGKILGVDISAEPGNILYQKQDGLYAGNTYVDAESSPVGEIISFMGKSAPDHYLFCDGTEYPIGSYPSLEAFFVDQFGTVNCFGGDGTNTFAVPDLRGEFLRCTGVNSHTNGGTGTEVGTHQAATSAPFALVYTSGALYLKRDAAGNSSFPKNVDATTEVSPALSSQFISSNPYTDSTAQVLSYTSRPTNTSVLYCIKYEPIHIVENEFLATKPHLWTENTEVDLGNGLYGFRKSGKITANANESSVIELVSLKSANVHIINSGGYYSIIESNNASSERMIGHYLVTSNGSVHTSAIYCSSNNIKLYTMSGINRVNCPFDVWVTYTKV